LSVTLFEKVHILQVFEKSDYTISSRDNPNQLLLL